MTILVATSPDQTDLEGCMALPGGSRGGLEVGGGGGVGAEGLHLFR